MLLNGKAAIITGSGRGLGRFTAIEMAKEGAKVVILSRTNSELLDTLSYIKSLNADAVALNIDISKGDSISVIVNETIKNFGKIDILMNNAAIALPVKPLKDFNLSQFNSTMDINLTAAFSLSCACLPHMIKQGSGKIINVTSGLAMMAMPLFGAYSVSKAALLHFTKILALELKPFNIQVNGLDPGMIDTKMQDDVRQQGPAVLGKEMYEELSALKKKHLLRSPQEPARLAVFLASAQSDNLTGNNGTIDYYSSFGFQLNRAQ
ncbi:short-chain dehydrogenase/reductase SDR [Candidatus Magnetoovum chiemensis]|nr:short-chain dehydrogenase/reductase SDR [Candidatus Magnetoovum chiemensis]